MSRLDVAPHKMNPNVHRTMVSIQALWRRVHKSKPTINQMLHCFLLKRSPHQVDFYYLHSAVGKNIESNPSSQKTWKPHWFYTSGAWEFVKGVDSRRPMIRRLFRMPGRAVRRDASIKHVFVEHTLELDRADLLTAKQEQVDVVLSLPSTEIAADKLLIREGMTAPLCNKCNQHEFGRAELFHVYTSMTPSRNDPAMQAKLIRMAKGLYGGLTGGSQPVQVGASPHMFVAGNQATGATTNPARGRQKRRADEHLPKDTRKRRAEEELRRDTEKRPMGSTASKRPRRASVDPISGPLKSWLEGEATLSAYQEAVRRILKVNVVDGLFLEEMGYNGMTMSALEDQLKTTIKLFIAAQNVAAHCEFDRGNKNEQAVTVAKLNGQWRRKRSVKKSWSMCEAAWKKRKKGMSICRTHWESHEMRSAISAESY
ncbi:unnamed protein product [Prunus armeniaca]